MVHCSLRGIVVTLLLRFVDDEARHRTDVHNGTRLRLQHVLAEGATAPERTVEIDVDNVQPVFVGHFLRGRFAPGNACIVDEDIDRTVTGCELVRHLADATRIRYIHDGDLCVQSFHLQAFATCLGDTAVAIGDHDFGSCLRERLRTRKANSLTATRHECGFSIKPELFQIHRGGFLLAYRAFGASGKWRAALTKSG